MILCGSVLVFSNQILNCIIFTFFSLDLWMVFLLYISHCHPGIKVTSPTEAKLLQVIPIKQVATAKGHFLLYSNRQTLPLQRANTEHIFRASWCYLYLYLTSLLMCMCAHSYSLCKKAFLLLLFLLFLPEQFCRRQGWESKAKSFFPFTGNASLGPCEM